MQPSDYRASVKSVYYTTRVLLILIFNMIQASILLYNVFKVIDSILSLFMMHKPKSFELILSSTHKLLLTLI